ncbi:MAG TPA: hypothetical protein VK558_05100 [Patescibacteria group bacterium]|nr:hypothetical protein [Patescibacteria group bacterium]
MNKYLIMVMALAASGCAPNGRVDLSQLREQISPSAQPKTSAVPLRCDDGSADGFGSHHDADCEAAKEAEEDRTFRLQIQCNNGAGDEKACRQVAEDARRRNEQEAAQRERKAEAEQQARQYVARAQEEVARRQAEQAQRANANPSTALVEYKAEMTESAANAALAGVAANCALRSGQWMSSFIMNYSITKDQQAKFRHLSPDEVVAADQYLSKIQQDIHAKWSCLKLTNDEATLYRLDRLQWKLNSNYH